MADPIPVTAIVLTFNEERNLPECLARIAGRVEQIIVVDSYSTDRTEEIARQAGAEFVRHEFITQSQQLQWALSCLPIRNEWVLRVDADERWSVEGLRKLAWQIRDPSVSAVAVRMKVYFMGRWIRHGGFYPNTFVRAFRRSDARVEDRWMDEHIVVDGRVAYPDIEVVEANVDRQRDITLWTDKHNRYSTREAVEILLAKHANVQPDTIGDVRGDRTQRKRWAKDNLYSRSPLLLRSFAYFLWRYFAQRGFLDGLEGFIFHLLQGFWYRFLVDVKVIQAERAMLEERISVTEAIRSSLGIQIDGVRP